MKKILFGLILSLLFYSQAYAYNGFVHSASEGLTGTGGDSLDEISCTNSDGNGHDLATGDVAIVTDPTTDIWYMYTFDLASDVGESSPDRIVPNDQASCSTPNQGEWILSYDGKINADKIIDGSTNAAITLTQETNFGTAYTHANGSTGADHTYIDQSVVSGATPTFTGTNFTSIPAGAYTAAGIDGDDINSNIAGRSLTLTAASPDTLDADSELYTDTIGFVLESPVDADAFLFWKAPMAITLTSVDCIIDAGTSVVIDIQECTSAGASCASSGGTPTCDTDGATDAAFTDAAFTDAAIDSGDWLNLDIGTVTGTVGYVTITVTYTKND